MIICSRCSERPVGDFESTKGRGKWCKTCSQEYDKARYARIGKDKWIRSRGEAVKRNRAWLLEYKKTLSCTVCAENHPACLDFHHREPSAKKDAIAQMHGYARKTILAEIAKCIVLCANCHRKLHHEQQLFDN